MLRKECGIYEKNNFCATQKFIKWEILWQKELISCMMPHFFA